MHIIYVSDRFLSDYKVRDSNIIGKHHYDVFPEIPEKWREVHRRALKGEVIRSEEDFFERADRTVDYTSWECRPWHKPDGAIGGMITYTEVITARKIAEQEIKNKNTFIQTVLDNLPIGIALNKFHEGKATYMNKKFMEIYGWDEEKLRNVNDFFERVYPDPAYREQISKMIMSDIESGRPERMQWENIMATAEDGSKRYINAYNIPLIDQNTMVSTVIDITKQKLNEQKIQQLNETLEQKIEQRTHELQLTNKDLQAFTHSVSHDLRAPLRAIDGFTRILQEDYDGLLDDEGKRVTKVIRDNTHKMKQLIDDLLNFSRLNRMEIQRSEIDMGTLANSVYYELTTDEDRNRISFTVSQLPRAYGDTTMIRQLWMNLISNALKFSASREKPEIHIFSSNESGAITYAIQDNGVGFDMRYVDNIFGVFQRLHSVRDFEGTGVGLAIVHRVIEKHGGTITAESKLDEYALFKFSIPIHSV